MPSNRPRFCIDELTLTNLNGRLVPAIDRLNSLLVRIHKDGLSAWKSKQVYYVTVCPEVLFSDLLYNPAIGLIDEDDRRLLVQVIDRCSDWEDSETGKEQLTTITGPKNASQSFRFIATLGLKGQAVAAIDAGESLAQQPEILRCGDTDVSVFSLADESVIRSFYRFSMTFEQLDEDVFEEWSTLAFDNLVFALTLRTQLGNFKQNYAQIRNVIVDHLTAINDDFHGMLTEGIQPQIICARIKATRNVTISPESPQTHKNQAAMNERRVVFDGQTVLCEFHTKLTPTHDRIHFCASLVRIEGKHRVVVGPFAEHLTT